MTAEHDRRVVQKKSVGDDPTHYCDDCDEPLTLLYDDRDDSSTPVVCGHCGGTNTRQVPREDQA